MKPYEPDLTEIVHETSVDFSIRTISQPIHIVQYDKSLPIIKVKLYNNGQPFYIPAGANNFKLRFGKPDKTFVYNDYLGYKTSMDVIYFRVTEQMTVIPGEYYPVVEWTIDGKIANTGAFSIHIDPNPIPNDYIESQVECKELIEYRDEALNAASEATNAASSAANSANEATNAASRASIDASEATDAASRAGNSANNASAYESRASNSAITASTAASNASDSASEARDLRDEIVKIKDEFIDSEEANEFGDI